MTRIELPIALHGTSSPAIQWALQDEICKLLPAAADKSEQACSAARDGEMSKRFP